MDTPETSAFLEAANVPDKGIVIMYQYLFGLQNVPASPFSNPLKFIQGHANNVWNIPPIEQTPFSNENLRLYSRSSAMQGIANAYERIVGSLHSVDTLSPEDKAVSVEHARDILKNLRMLQSSQDEETQLSAVTDPKVEEARMMLRAAIAFKNALAMLAKTDSTIVGNPLIADAVSALDNINMRIKSEATYVLYKEGEFDAAKAMSKRLAASPLPQSSLSFNEIITKLDMGLGEAGRLQAVENLPPMGVAKEMGLTPSPQLQQALKPSADKFAAGKVSQVSDAGLIEPARQVNEAQQVKGQEWVKTGMDIRK